MARAYSPTEILTKKYKTIDWGKEWQNAFGSPETTGVWFIWGNSSNGKSSFVMQLVQELAKRDKVFFNALEEGIQLTMQENIKRANIVAVKQNILIGCESMTELDQRLKKRKAPKIVVIDSFQYTNLSFAAFRKFKAEHHDKLIVFVSQAKGKQPLGRTADSVKYDASLKIWVEGYKAISNGRYNPGGVFTIWEQGANQYWGNKNK